MSPNPPLLIQPSIPRPPRTETIRWKMDWANLSWTHGIFMQVKAWVRKAARNIQALCIRYLGTDFFSALFVPWMVILVAKLYRALRPKYLQGQWAESPMPVHRMILGKVQKEFLPKSRLPLGWRMVKSSKKRECLRLIRLPFHLMMASIIAPFRTVSAHADLKQKLAWGALTIFTLFEVCCLTRLQEPYATADQASYVSKVPSHLSLAERHATSRWQP